MSNQQSTSVSGPRGLGSAPHGTSNLPGIQGLSPNQNTFFGVAAPAKPGQTLPSPTSSSSSTNDDNQRVDDPDFKYPGADLHLQVGNRHFRLHQDMLRDFKGLGPELDKAVKGGEGRLKRLVLEENAQDVRNTLLMLYTKPYEPQHFDAKTLESCLKLATKYSNPGLRDYAIKQLGQMSLGVIDLFRLGRDYDVGVWKMMALGTLSSRDEPLTVAEALVLGTEEFINIAANREKVKFQKGQGTKIFGKFTPASGTDSVKSAKGPSPTSDLDQKKQVVELPHSLQAAVQSS